ncbi:hypothetical protein K503DRAFT_652153, partial [Rhizopogon vinicolor AM-OR11-026]
ITPAYSFMDYRSQGQTIANSIIDIGTPPTSGLTPFKMCTLRYPEVMKFERLARLDDETEKWWKE